MDDLVCLSLNTSVRDVREDSDSDRGYFLVLFLRRLGVGRKAKPRLNPLE